MAYFTARRATEERPDDPFGWTVLARAAAGAGRPEEARRAVERALTLHPEDAALHAEHGLLLEQAGELDRALASYRTAVRRAEPGDGEPAPAYGLDLARVLAALGHWEEAVAAAEEVRQRAPQDRRAREVLAAVLLGRALAAQDELSDGTLVIRTAPQARFVAGTVEQALRLRPADAETVAALQENAAAASRALRRTFSPATLRRRRRLPLVAAALLVAVFCCVPSGLEAGSRDGGGGVALVVVAVLLLLALVGAVVASCVERVYAQVALRAERVGVARAGSYPQPERPPRRWRTG